MKKKSEFTSSKINFPNTLFTKRLVHNGLGIENKRTINWLFTSWKY